jgi:hypothetical protein
VAGTTRDPDLCREILRRLEAHPELLHADLPEINGRSQEEIAYHLGLLCEAGLLWSDFKEAQRLASDNIFAEKVSKYIHMYRNQDRYRLTWLGHEFLDAARDNTRWNNAKRKVKENTGGLAFEFLKAVLMQKGKELLGLD